MTSRVCSFPSFCSHFAVASVASPSSGLKSSPSIPTGPSLPWSASACSSSASLFGGEKVCRVGTHLTERACGGSGVRVYAARKNVTSRKIQQSKGRTTERPNKLGSVGVPVESNPLIQGNNLTGDSLLNEDQAIGQVITAQANFMRVIVEKGGKLEAESRSDGGGTAGDGNARAVPDELDSRAALEPSEGEINGADSPLSTTTQDKRLELLCVVRGLLKKIKRRVLVGDRVLVSGIDWTEKRGMIEEVLDRSSEIVDPPVANVNYLLVVFSIDQPQIDEKVLSRFLVEAESTEIDFTLVLNKADLVDPKVVEWWQTRLADWGYTPVLCSADQRIGLTDLTSVVKNRVTVILGPSGVGKSSLINALRDQKGLPLWYESDQMRLSEMLVDGVDRAEVPALQYFDATEDFEELRVGEVSLASGRGKHTTRHVSLLRIPSGVGLLADTPGFSQPSLAKVSASSLPQLFPEVRKRIADSENGGCAFPNCMHLGEPNCAVGDDWDRYSLYLDLLDEIRTRERVQKKVLGTKRESDMRYKMGAEGVKKAEPRLALNKHRRESRKLVNQSLEEVFREAEELQADMEDDIDEEAGSV
ncbi:ribosome biogenesis GTPase / thiamine phosphate phosphatase [Marchantia polymorpha subsp. ruderalis]|uniref:EngC GTPase domain-containing protein n=2 Tax=Marchantia polymorpha TaxID=3197 RepID=A0A176W965_MARPO|nr:hypothetical protein AXG93_702s1230 [Marchantia polymorpha subsp. ruderalis]PTQ34770.1 hypothetical protein MARPO_0076s0016 [Marchantia polymorpha]BBN16607.1 hypothetical protein Mp_7g07780 [Marchantia polymorpha subsp. ruderalis]|eukprot:PTQ34770.1 hypothetical protein MARPO_0076s0016 [Marchantia polymorpha]